MANNIFSQGTSASYSLDHHNPDDLQKIAVFNGLKIIDIEKASHGFSIKCKRGNSFFVIEVNRNLITVLNHKREAILKMGEEIIEQPHPTYRDWQILDHTSDDISHWTAETNNVTYGGNTTYGHSNL